MHVVRVIADDGVGCRYMYPSTDSPRYLAGGSATAGVCLACAAMALAVRFCLKRENAKLEMAEEREDEEGAAVGQGEDVRAAGFRYII